MVLLTTVFLTYSRVLHFGFISLDDPEYVTDNPHVQAGLTLAGVVWAFSPSFASGWFPLTWLSLMLDSQLFGLDSGWYHFTNLWMHAISTVLWFVVLKRITGARWKSALVAFLFALHPLHVESVAWVCERKDVLSGLFCALTLWAYSNYISRPAPGRYILTLLLFCLGLMAKSMLVTLPLLLILLDQWPFRRGFKLLEKIPFFAASIAVSMMTLLVHRTAGALPSFSQVPATLRFENALISYVVYLLKMFWPVHLALFYPYSYGSLFEPAVMSGLVIGTITVFAFRMFTRCPYLFVGWLWYLISLLPVIGFIQAGASARADRFTYIPMFGVAILLVWAASEAFESWPAVRFGLTAAVCSGCIVLTWIQVGYWRDSISAYRHAIDVTSGNYLAHYNLASVLEAEGDSTEAVAQLRETVRLRPLFGTAHAELGQLLAKRGQFDAALRELQTALELNPDSADTRFRLGSVLGSLGRTSDAAVEFQEVIRLQPDNADGHYNLGLALAQEGRLQDAVPEFSATVRLRPADAVARYNLGIVLARLGQIDQSATQLSEAVRLKPDFPEGRQALADLNRLRGVLPGKQN